MGYYEKGHLFFNFGRSCALRLITAVYSLYQQNPQYPVGVMLNSDDPDELNDFIEQALSENVLIQRLPFESEAHRQVKCAIKPYLLRQQIWFKRAALYDGDVLFAKNPDEILNLDMDKQMLLTQFSTWRTNGNRMRKRVRAFYEWLPERVQAKLNKGVPAINLGVMVYDHDGHKTLAEWEELTNHRAGKHIADEVAANCMVAWRPEVVGVISEKYNVSPRYGEAHGADAVIHHFHGNKHANFDYPSSSAWLEAVKLMRDDDSFGQRFAKDEILTWNDKAFVGFLNQNKGWLDAPS